MVSISHIQRELLSKMKVQLDFINFYSFDQFTSLIFFKDKVILLREIDVCFLKIQTLLQLGMQNKN